MATQPVVYGLPRDLVASRRLDDAYTAEVVEAAGGDARDAAVSSSAPSLRFVIFSP